MKKNIMIVDDSALMRRVMCDIITSDSSFEVKDVSRDGQEAYEKIVANKYDAIVLDVNMPRMGGLELLKKLHKEKIDVVVIMASTLTSEGSKETIEALELGAVDFVTKPGNVIEARGEDFSTSLLNVLRAVLKTPSQRLSTQAVVGTTTRRTETASRSEVTTRRTSPMSAPTTRINEKLPEHSTVRNGNKLVALACSTGGPKSLQSVIPMLPKEMDAPVVIVQHMPPGFTKSLADRLNELSKVTVAEAQDGDVLQNGHVYIAPGGKHLTVVKRNGGGHMIKLDDSPPVGTLKPCADIMYRSLTTCGYDEICCVVLTGMGADGAQGILDLRKRKPVFTISQSAETCVVYGMPKAVAEAGLSNKVVPLEQVASTIIMNVGVQ
ncbi:MAG: chemotaxis response regulator protein-glutamate methylesterase [Lachnospiraceae bacterium]|nr:chemotaxis response regulator protein-glutamate methylesterase [Lachnospiraceae bacterium]